MAKDAVVEADAPTEPVFSDELAEVAFNSIKELIVARNALVGQANAAHGDRVTLTEQITENSTDAKIVAARKQRDDAIMALHELVTPQVEKTIADAAGSVGAIEEEVKAHDEKIKPGVTYLKKMYGESPTSPATFLPSLERVKGMTVRAGGGGGRRIRGFNVITTVDGESQEHENFASAAKWLEKETTDLQEAFFEAAGQPKQVKDAPDEVEFEVEFTETYEDSDETETKVATVKAYRPEPLHAEAETASE